MTQSGAQAELSEKPDFFTDADLCADPYPFFEALREEGPVTVEPFHNVAIMTAYETAMSVFNDPSNFSACVGASGPLPPLAFMPEGDDIGDQIARHRPEMHCSDLINTYDRPEHPRARGLMMRLFTPRRLLENEAYLRRTAERLIDDVIAKRSVEVVAGLGNPFATLVIADLLGIPEDEREIYRDRLTATPAPIGGEASDQTYQQRPLEFLHERFTQFIENRRATPIGDVLSELATATYNDGTIPSVIEVVRVAVNLFAAGQETTARLLASALRILAERQDLQMALRAKPDQIGAFVEEVLRLDGPIKGTFRLTSRTTRIADVELKAGTIVMVAIPTINRDPGRYDRPDEIVLDRPKIREHLAFGRGVHTCPGAPLARVEVRVMLERLLARTSAIGLSADHHGAEGRRRFDYAPTYLIRGLDTLHLELTPRPGEIETGAVR